MTYTFTCNQLQKKAEEDGKKEKREKAKGKAASKDTAITLKGGEVGRNGARGVGVSREGAGGARVGREGKGSEKGAVRGRLRIYLMMQGCWEVISHHPRVEGVKVNRP